MTADEIRRMLEKVQSGTMPIEVAASELARSSDFKLAEMEYATLDLQRKDRCGFPEVIFAEGKTAEWVEGGIRRLLLAGQDCFVTRVSQVQSEHLARQFPEAEQDRLARTFWLAQPGDRPSPAGRVCVVTAGTSDLPIAQEALVTARVLGANAELWREYTESCVRATVSEPRMRLLWWREWMVHCRASLVGWWIAP
jgi:hypothetical protein